MVTVRSRGNQGKEPKGGLNGKHSDHLGKMFGVGRTYVEQARFAVDNDPPAAQARSVARIAASSSNSCPYRKRHPCRLSQPTDNYVRQLSYRILRPHWRDGGDQVG